MKIDTEKLNELVEQTIAHCRRCDSCESGCVSCLNKRILSACGKRVPNREKGKRLKGCILK